MDNNTKGIGDNSNAYENRYEGMLEQAVRFLDKLCCYARLAGNDVEQAINGKNVVVHSDYFDLNEDDAMMLGLEQGDIIDVVSAHSRMRGTVQITQIVKGLVGSVKSFGDFVQRLELSKVPDKFMKMEGLPLIPIQIERVE